MPHAHDLMEITQPEAEALLRRNPVVVIPTGSVEQHGPHLPFGTDYYAAFVLARRVAELLDALLVPFTPVGVTPIHMSFAGTISLEPETFTRLLTDVVRSLARHGAQRFVVVNWHELNKPYIDQVATTMQQESEVRFVHVQAHFVALEMFGQEAGLTHGGLLEALPVLALDPALAQLEKGTNPSSQEDSARMDFLRRRRETYLIPKDVRDLYPTGWYGTLEGASLELASEFVEAVSQRISQYVGEALDALRAEDPLSP